MIQLNKWMIINKIIFMKMINMRMKKQNKNLNLNKNQIMMNNYINNKN